MKGSKNLKWDSFQWQETGKKIRTIQSSEPFDTEAHRPKNDKNPYEICHSILAIAKHFGVFGNKWHIKRNDDNLSTFDARDDEGIFLGYYQS